MKHGVLGLCLLLGACAEAVDESPKYPYIDSLAVSSNDQQCSCPDGTVIKGCKVEMSATLDYENTSVSFEGKGFSAEVAQGSILGTHRQLASLNGTITGGKMTATWTNDAAPVGDELPRTNGEVRFRVTGLDAGIDVERTFPLRFGISPEDGTPRIRCAYVADDQLRSLQHRRRDDSAPLWLVTEFFEPVTAADHVKYTIYEADVLFHDELQSFAPDIEADGMRAVHRGGGFGGGSEGSTLQGSTEHFFAVEVTTDANAKPTDSYGSLEYP